MITIFMIPAIILWLIRQYWLTRHKEAGIRITLTTLANKVWRIAAIVFLILLLVSLTARAQSRSLNYKILRNGNKVGTLHFTESVSGNTYYLQLESEVKTRFIFSFTAKAKEQAAYSNGILTSSSIYRILNGNEKANKQHHIANNHYLIQAGKNAALSKIYPITYNMLSLYTKEPLNINSVYSDNFEISLQIEEAGTHKYRINFPDGNYNYYSYRDGILNEIEIHHSFYSASIVLTQ